MQQWYQCPRCSAKVAFGVRFCSNCGTQLTWPTQQQAQPPQVGYGQVTERVEQKKTNSGLISCLGFIAVVLLIAGATFALHEPNANTPTQPKYVQQYKNRQPPVLTEYGKQIHLDNNPDAMVVSFADLKSFIRQDDTSEKPYLVMTCADFAEQVHNNAERTGIKAAFVAVNFAGEEIGHALNAFMTTDEGLVYVDCTGQGLKPISVPMITGEKRTVFDEARPGEYDKVAYIEEGKQYGIINIDKAESLQYSFYIEYASNLQKLSNMIDDFNSEVDAFNEALDGRTVLAEPEYSKFQDWQTQLLEKQQIILSLANKLGNGFEPLGIVETVKIYW